ncbi:hypothetical protein SY83_03175 [Paenibacillus swuensis]|uniref:DUF3243 domain-containing protein n=1 Tax=Paenibacillus swuensis TaxID=1178515 RepID=A0A172TEJ4_9BACL|nr:DUF3243 domain-containing protein [Paenibacillus swuensis]ANE45485.1 hypothetical protein SY83_03175 [Paenibacillus swuensis]
MSEHNHVIEKDGDLQTNKVTEVVERMGSKDKDRILADFEEFRGYLAKRIKMGEAIGLSEEQLAATAEKVADYLANHEEPRNAEEQLLQELWKVGNEEQRHMLAHMLVRLAQAKQ